jgi:hypothetical protein
MVFAASSIVPVALTGLVMAKAVIALAGLRAGCVMPQNKILPKGRMPQNKKSYPGRYAQGQQRQGTTAV